MGGLPRGAQGSCERAERVLTDFPRVISASNFPRSTVEPFYHLSSIHHPRRDLLKNGSWHPTSNQYEYFSSLTPTHIDYIPPKPCTSPKQGGIAKLLRHVPGPFVMLGVLWVSGVVRILGLLGHVCRVKLWLIGIIAGVNVLTLLAILTLVLMVSEVRKHDMDIPGVGP